jgi:acid phosphatase class B
VLLEKVYESTQKAYEGGSASYSEMQDSWYNTLNGHYKLLSTQQSYYYQLIDLHSRTGGEAAGLFSTAAE